MIIWRTISADIQVWTLNIRIFDTKLKFEISALLFVFSTLDQCFHLQGNFLAKGNFGTCREKCKEIKLTRK
jgi:hypothetical protein